MIFRMVPPEYLLCTYGVINHKMFSPFDTCKLNDKRRVVNHPGESEIVSEVNIKYPAWWVIFLNNTPETTFKFVHINYL